MADPRKQTEEFEIIREFDAPPSLVFRTWTEPELMRGWWGPTSFTTPHCEIEPRPGGRLLLCMRSPEGQDFWCGGTFEQVEAPSRLVFSSYFCDKTGQRVSPAEYGMEGWPEQTRVTVTFTDLDGRTRLFVHENVPAELAQRFSAQQGWSESFDKLNAQLDGLRTSQRSGEPQRKQGRA